MDTTKTATHVSLCAGYGGIDLGLKRAIPSLRTIAFSEIEAFACANLVAKMEAGHLDPAPIWTDVKTFPYASFHGKVDILSGGYPCQPFSAAGKRLGADDPRHLWPFIADGVAAMRPEWCFFENVEGHISLGLPNVIEDLAGMGYRTAWGIFSASECGAPHQRKRVFILAHRNGARLERFSPECVFQEGREKPSGSTSTSGRNGAFGYVPDALRYGGGKGGLLWQGPNGEQPFGPCYARPAWPSRPGEPQYGWEPPRVLTPLADTSSIRFSKREHASNVAEASKKEQKYEQGFSANGIIGCDSNEFVADASIIDGQWGSARTGRRSGSEIDVTGGDEEQQREVEPALGGDVDGSSGGLDYAQLRVACDNRTDELRLLGNGVVPATAERAFTTLFQRLLTYA